MATSTGTSTDHLDLLTKLEQFMLGDHVDTVAIVAGGAGHVIGDVITLTDGTFNKAARFQVLTVSGGAITSLRIIDSGAYSVNPDTTATTSWTTSGVGTGATFNLTMEVSNWSKILDDTTLDTSTERVVLFQETVNDVFIGFRTYTQVTGARTAKNWIVFGFTSYNGGLPWYQQPDASPSGFSTVNGTHLQTTAGGSFFVAKANDGFAMTYWFHVTDRRVVVINKLFNATTVTTPRYGSLYAGLLNQFGTNAEIPYPLYVAGCSAGYQTAWDDLTPAFQFNGLSQAGGITGRVGPGFYYHTDGAWKSVRNWNQSGPGVSTRGASQDYVLYPVGQPRTTAGPDVIIVVDSPTIQLQWGTMIELSSFSAATVELHPTPDSTAAGGRRPMVPLTLVLSLSPDADLAGELDGLYFVSAAGSTAISAEDIVDDGAGGVFYCFPNGTYSQLDGFMAVRQD